MKAIQSLIVFGLAVTLTACTAEIASLITPAARNLSTTNTAPAQDGVKRISAGAVWGQSQSVNSQVGGNQANAQDCSGLAVSIVVEQLAAATCQTLNGLKNKLTQTQQEGSSHAQ